MDSQIVSFGVYRAKRIVLGTSGTYNGSNSSSDSESADDRERTLQQSADDNSTGMP
jgi:hypothetical protein